MPGIRLALHEAHMENQATGQATLLLTSAFLSFLADNSANVSGRRRRGPRRRRWRSFWLCSSESPYRGLRRMTAWVAVAEWQAVRPGSLEHGLCLLD